MFTEPLPNYDRGYTYRHADWLDRFMKHATEMSSGVMIYIPSFLQIGSGIQNLIRGGYKDRVEIS
jgi:uncharacterized protein YbbC (DUF1343 family)